MEGISKQWKTLKDTEGLKTNLRGLNGTLDLLSHMHSENLH